MVKWLTVPQAVKFIQPHIWGRDGHTLLAELRRNDRQSSYFAPPFTRKNNRVFYRAEDLQTLIESFAAARSAPKTFDPPTARKPNAKDGTSTTPVVNAKDGSVVVRFGGGVFVRLNAAEARKLAENLVVAAVESDRVAR